MASQRERMIAAVIDAVAAKGYVHATVADVLARAGVSRATFYEQFTDKEDCFVAAFEARAALLAAVLADAARAAAAAGRGPLERVDEVLGTYLEILRAAPAEARALLIEVYAAGPRAVEQRNRSLEQFVQVVVDAYGEAPGILGTAADQRFAAQILVGGVSSMVTLLVGAGQTERLPALRAQLVELLAKLP